MDKSDEEETWDNLTKDYLTVKQKIAIIREHNSIIADDEWKQIIDSLRDYLNRKVK